MDKSKSEDTSGNKIYSLIYEECKDAFKQEISRISFLDQKINILFVFFGILISIGIFNLENYFKFFSTINNINYKMTFMAILILILISMFISLIFIILAFKIVKYKTYPDSKLIISSFSNKREIDYLASMANHYAETTKHNELLNEKKATNLKLSIIFMSISFLLFFLFALLKLLLFKGI